MISTLLLTVIALASESEGLLDTTEVVGLGPEALGIPAEHAARGVSRVCFADLNGDSFPDVVVDRHRVFLNVAGEEELGCRRFDRVSAERTGLLEPANGTVTVFADLSDDGILDAIVGEYVDLGKEGWEDHGRRTAWQKGRGDGTFEAPQRIDGLRPATTCAIAAGDVDLDGRLDLWLGSWYVEYGPSLEAYPNQLLLSGAGSPRVVDLPPDSPAELDAQADLGGRPTYGAMIALLGPGPRPDLLELDYGRRWNRLWRLVGEGEDARWVDLAPAARFDGDEIRHGRYPDWAVQRMAERSPPVELTPEPPFRANGNTFDCAVGDVDSDGDFDVFVAEITHGWAGDSADRSRLLYDDLQLDGTPRFHTAGSRSFFDRIPEGVQNWNQGDLFCALADLDHDTRLDVLLSSGDYPDRQILRYFAQIEDGVFEDRTASIGLEHDGSQQLSLADFDGDGDLDVLAGQTFFRYSAELKGGRTPTVRLFRNELTEGRKSLTLRLEGDGVAVNRHGLGAVVRARLEDGTVLSRQLVGPGGHAGKQNDFALHFGLGEHAGVEELVVSWPDAKGSTSTFESVAAGRYRLEWKGELERLE